MKQENAPNSSNTSNSSQNPYYLPYFQNKTRDIHKKIENKPYYVPYFQNKSDNSTKFESVRLVKELSPAAKREIELRESGDYEYLKILNAGYETPKFVNRIFNNYETPVINKFQVDYLWTPLNSSERDLWKDVEYNKYQNDFVGEARQRRDYTPPHIRKDEFGNILVHSPSDSTIRITKTVPTIKNLGR